jgi:transcriptional regulator with XRE-family HTH domain
LAKNWDAVAEAINTRLAELEMTQIELATKSRVSTATLRQIQKGVPKRRGPRTLGSISEALGWPSGHLEKLAEGESADVGNDRLSALEAEVTRLAARVQKIENASGEASR